MECALACGALLLPLGVLVPIALGVLVAIPSIRQVRAKQDELDGVLEALGFERVPGDPAWRAATVAGVPLAARIARSAVRTGGMQHGTTHLQVTAKALVAVDLPPLGGRISHQRRPRSTEGFAAAFYAELGASLEEVPAPVQEVLMAWTREVPEDDLVLVDRASRHAYAGKALPDATVLLRAERDRIEADALEPWLAEVARRAAALR